MAAKKTAKKSTESVTPKVGPKSTPTAKKAAKKVTKKAASVSAKPAVAQKSLAPAPVKLTADQIARAAYLNYRRRVEQGLPGDSHGDWLEAEKQLGKR